MKRAISAVVILFALGCGAGPVAPPAGSAVASLQQAVLSETERLVSARAALDRATTDSERATLEASLNQAAERRETALLALMEAAPEVALGTAMPAAERDRLPPQAREHVEKTATETGTLELLGRLGEDGSV